MPQLNVKLPLCKPRNYREGIKVWFHSCLIWALGADKAFRPGRLTAGETVPSTHHVGQVGRTAILMLWRREKSRVPIRNRIPYHPAHNVVPTPITQLSNRKI